MNTLEKVKQAALAMQRYSWEQGVVAQAFLEAGDRSTAVLLAAEGIHRQRDDGRCCQLGAGSASTDPCAIGEALIAAWEDTGDPTFAQGVQGLLRWALEIAPRNQEGIVYHFDNRKEFWVDSFYMLPPFLARAGQYEAALQQLDGYWQALYNVEAGLLSHRWDDEKKVLVRSDFWGVGNGWVAAGMARVIALLPESLQQQRKRLIHRVKGLLDAALRYQRPDGMFHDVINVPDTFPEVNFGQMLAYTIFRGVKEGWLDRSYLPQAHRMRQAARAQVDRYGLVHQVCGAPHFDAPGTAAEGQAFYILMESAGKSLEES